MSMQHPPHPGRSIRDACLEPLGLSVTEGAKVLGISRTQLSRIINGRAAISGDMAIRLSKAFGSTPRAWLKMQWAHDLALAEQHADRIQVERYVPTNDTQDARV